MQWPNQGGYVSFFFLTRRDCHVYNGVCSLQTKTFKIPGFLPSSNANEPSEVAIAS